MKKLLYRELVIVEQLLVYNEVNNVGENRVGRRWSISLQRLST